MPRDGGIRLLVGRGRRGAVNGGVVMVLLTVVGGGSSRVLFIYKLSMFWLHVDRINITQNVNGSRPDPPPLRQVQLQNRAERSSIASV